jgi:hypothetical protein
LDGIPHAKRSSGRWTCSNGAFKAAGNTPLSDTDNVG